MKRLPHLVTTLVIVIFIYTVQALNIDEYTLSNNYTLTGAASVVANGIQLTADATGTGSRVLYTVSHDVALGFTVKFNYEVSGAGNPGYGEGIGLVLTGDKTNFLTAVQSQGGDFNLPYLTNMVAINLNMVFQQVRLCQVNNSATLPQMYLATNECDAPVSYTGVSGPGTHTMTIDYVVVDSVTTTWTVTIDNNAPVSWTKGPLIIDPVTPNQYYFGWTASTGAYSSARVLTGWSANITEPCITNNGGCSENATCSYFGGGLVNCTCLSGYEGDGYTCTLIPPVPVAPPVNPPVVPPVTEPVSPPIEAPIAPPVVAPISPPIAPPVDTPIAAIVDDPKALGADVLVPAIVIPVVGVAAALFFGIYFGKKAQAKKKEKEQEASDDVESGDGAVAMTNVGSATGIAPSNYATVPAMNRASGQYNSIPEVGDATEESDVGAAASKVNPTGISPADIDKRMHIPYKSLVFTKEIGAGSYGKVFLGEWRGAEVAIKVNNTVTDMDGFLAEAKLTLGIAPHPNLVQTFGVSLDGSYPCIVLEFCGGGSLDKIVFDNASTITDAKRKEFALKIAYGLIHLHNNSIVHRDLAARNILLSTEGQPKVSDFGMSRVIQDEEAKGKTKTNVGPLRWMSPESLKDKSYSVKSDVWSYGILVWEIVAGREPHADEDQLFVGVKIRDEAFHPAIPDDCDPTLRQVMEMCWQKDPADRPTMEEISKYLRKN